MVPKERCSDIAKAHDIDLMQAVALSSRILFSRPNGTRNSKLDLKLALLGLPLLKLVTLIAAP